LEQLVRKYFTGSVPDPEKYCFNVWGARMGGWLFTKLDARVGPRGATQNPVPVPRPNPALPPQPIVNQPWAPAGSQGVPRGSVGDWQSFE